MNVFGGRVNGPVLADSVLFIEAELYGYVLARGIGREDLDDEIRRAGAAPVGQLRTVAGRRAVPLSACLWDARIPDWGNTQYLANTGKRFVCQEIARMCYIKFIKIYPLMLWFDAGLPISC